MQRNTTFVLWKVLTSFIGIESLGQNETLALPEESYGWRVNVTSGSIISEAKSKC